MASERTETGADATASHEGDYALDHLGNFFRGVSLGILKVVAWIILVVLKGIYWVVAGVCKLAFQFVCFLVLAMLRFCRSLGDRRFWISAGKFLKRFLRAFFWLIVLILILWVIIAVSSS